MTIRRASLLVPLVTLLAVLTGCSQPPPQPRPAIADRPVPVVAPSQLDRIVGEVSTVLTAGDQANDANALAPRVDGAALQLRQAAYAIRAGLSTQPVPAPIGTARLVDIVPVDQAWPRFAMTVTQTAADAVPRLELLTQSGARDPYRLTASATLLPGVTLPRTAPPASGVEALPPTEPDDRKVSPVDALAHYADVLTAGPGSQFAAEFADDAFRSTVVGEQDAERTAAGTTCPGCFAYAVTHTPRADAVWSVRTDDGGAIVVGVLDSTRTFTVAAAGSKLPIPADLAVLAGKAEAAQSAAIVSVEVVALHLPPPGSAEPVRVLAADRGVVQVTAA